VGGMTMFELLYGRRFGPEELSSQPLKFILYESLVYDNEIEMEYIHSKQSKSSDKKVLYDMNSREIKEIMEQRKKFFTNQYKEDDDAEVVVTLLTTEEYLEIAGTSTNNDRILFTENSSISD
jgi:hypothetical protein